MDEFYVQYLHTHDIVKDLLNFHVEKRGFEIELWL